MIAPRRLILALVLVGILVNFGSLRPAFIHDDHRIIEQNDLTRDLSQWRRIFGSGYWSASDVQVPNLYRPVTILTFALDRMVHGLNPLGFRLVNLLLHVFNTLLVFALGRRLDPQTQTGGARPVGPFFAALLFAVHPAHTEVLGEIVGRAELLAAAGALGSACLFLRAREADPRGRSGIARAGLLLLALLFFVLAFLAKENAVVVPGLLLLADLLVVRRRPAWGFHAVSGLALLGLLALRANVLGAINPAGAIHFVDNPIAHLPFAEGRLTALKVLARYALLLVWPAEMSIDYSYRAILPASSLLDPGVLAGAAVLVAWTVLLALTLRRKPSQAFPIAWMGLSFAPVANLLFPIGTIMADRLLYLPSAGFCLAAGALLPGSRTGIKESEGWFARRVGAFIVPGLIVAALATRSIVRLNDWRDDYTIFKAALSVTPDSVRALFNYGSTCEERGEDPLAVEAYERAIALWPDFADAHYNLAGVLARQKKWEGAIEQYREALRREPGEVRYLVNLAHALMAIERPSEAREYLHQAIVADPKSAYAYTNLGAAELALKDPQAALAAYREAVRLEPGNADYLRNLGVARREAHDPGAADTFREALSIRPGDPDLLDGLGLALLDGGDAAGARAALEQAIQGRPEHPVFRYHLGRALEQSGELQKAREQYREAIRLAPAVPVPYKALGLLLDRLGDGTGAVAALERAAALDPGGTIMDEATRRRLSQLQRGAASGRPR